MKKDLKTHSQKDPRKTKTICRHGQKKRLSANVLCEEGQQFFC